MEELYGFHENLRIQRVSVNISYVILGMLTCLGETAGAGRRSEQCLFIVWLSFSCAR